ncbi:MBL fold metallo-hydrolase [Mariniblastus fucicola]|uniref:Beta-lactamase hydrolase-like protein n=1 Tax=Mariniblastus fucicola TaxID=980251 RepID=A0A5B9PEV7_9BACT|nr:MBL fold metallo-hydrolase [Mariniblastus fucicola]QEG23735.1 Beta-lactamase hydrolase-like protein [Mariniblastus fucicola]
MLLKYFYDKSLAHASYMVGCQKTGEAILIDPDRNIDQYLDVAEREGMTIVGSAETHIHADYVSGSRELAEAIGAKLYVSDEGPADWKYTFVDGYDHQLLKDGNEFAVGNIKFKVMHTPGHTPESISFILTDTGGGADRPMGIFTGDFVFVGSIGRPDLLEEAAGQAGTAEPGARDLFASIKRFNELPDFLQVWPSHGAGSACGKGLGAIPSSTVGYEKLFNEALQFKSEDEFVAYVLSDQPEAPPYFAVMKHVNKHGPKVIGDEGLPKKIDIAKLTATVEDHMVIDVGASKSFARNHVPGALNIPTKYIARDAGWYVDYSKPLYLIAGGAELADAIHVFREMGVDNIVGYFDGDEVAKSGLATEAYEYKTPEEVAGAIERGDMLLVDVRRQAEWNEGHIPQADHRFLGKILDSVKEIDDSKPVVFHCRSGARSAVACGIAQASGIKNVINLDGGIVRWEKEGNPVVSEQPQSVGCGESC